MADEMLEYRSATPGRAGRIARLGAMGVGGLYLLLSLAIGVGVVVSAYEDRDGGPEAWNFVNPWFYLALIAGVALPGAIAWGFVWTAGSVKRGLPRNVILGKYLAILNLALIGVEGAGIVTGLIMDPPKGNDRAIAMVVCGADILLLGGLLFLVWALERAVKEMTQEKEHMP